MTFIDALDSAGNSAWAKRPKSNAGFQREGSRILMRSAFAPGAQFGGSMGAESAAAEDWELYQLQSEPREWVPISL